MKTIDIFGVIGDLWDGLTSAAIADQLKDHEGGELLVRINSPGGFASEGINIYNLLKSYNPVVEVGGLAASAASIVMMAGKERRMLTGSRVMVHNAWTVEAGNKYDMRASDKQLSGLDEALADIYAEAGMDREAAVAAMDAETYYNAAEAVEVGLATQVVKKEAGEMPENSAVVLAAMGCRVDGLTKEQNLMAREMQFQAKKREAASRLERMRKGLRGSKVPG